MVKKYIVYGAIPVILKIPANSIKEAKETAKELVYGHAFIAEDLFIDSCFLADDQTKGSREVYSEQSAGGLGFINYEDCE